MVIQQFQCCSKQVDVLVLDSSQLVIYHISSVTKMMGLITDDYLTCQLILILVVTVVCRDEDIGS
jgi:uncharacterized membrane-anchored protein